MTADQLRDLIAASLNCTHLEVDGDGRHWSAVVVSDAFAGLRPIARHQRVYATLGQKMHTDEVHALSMKTYTPTEWPPRANERSARTDRDGQVVDSRWQSLARQCGRGRSQKRRPARVVRRLAHR